MVKEQKSKEKTPKHKKEKRLGFFTTKPFFFIHKEKFIEVVLIKFY